MSKFVIIKAAALRQEMSEIRGTINVLAEWKNDGFVGGIGLDDEDGDRFVGTVRGVLSRPILAKHIDAAIADLKAEALELESELAELESPAERVQA